MQIPFTPFFRPLPPLLGALLAAGPLACDDGGAAAKAGESTKAGESSKAAPAQPAAPRQKVATAKVSCEPKAGGFPEMRLTPVASGLRRPVYVAGVPGDDGQLFVLEQPGRVRVIQDGALLPTPFLDLTGKVNSQHNEQGLLGLAFHPRYAENGLVYIHYTAQAQSIGGVSVPSGAGVTVEFRVDPANPARGLLESERLVLAIEQPQGNHNGGNLQFDPKGLLVLGFGDGGAGGDPHGSIGNGQALDTLLGKMLRIDVDGRGAGAYGIPPGNMAEATGKAARPEIWSYGWRNPWRFSFDACTGDLYAADVGQHLIEEVDFEPAGTAAGRNYGWRLMEAGRCFNPTEGCDAAAQGLELPIASYGRDLGVSITGGYVYRGSALPGLRGTYLYADFQSARFFALEVVDAKASSPVEITENLNRTNVAQIASFGQDNDGELYVVSLEGGIYRIAPL